MRAGVQLRFAGKAVTEGSELPGNEFAPSSGRSDRVRRI